MATNGNSSTTQQLEKVAQAAMANVARRPTMVEDFLARVEHAAQLLDVVAHELGDAGGQDERELVAVAEQVRADARRAVEKVLSRMRRRVGELETRSRKTSAMTTAAEFLFGAGLFALAYRSGRPLAVAMAMNAPAELRMFSLLLVAKPDSNPDPGIRHILKLALRRYGLRCVEARELPPPSTRADTGT